ncbi:hypothetical protein INS49_006200 [Diaporthe citri]|uniref:uncharacterized protein n=1 Tax=Diaporthe citri TaxID=83186 RepID=UPI001C7F9F88|nr:uncharacterized protein INS49_006200 [Diaporthe citri]KAG6364598.1 hypothetical protein INS49_006200 [Diaporthe citri]
MERMMELARNFITSLRQWSYAAMLSHLCSVRNLQDDSLRPQVSPSEDRLAGLAPANLADDRQNCQGTFNECGQNLKPTGSVVFVLGAPGAGKGTSTQCTFLAQQFGFHHLSYGDFCRRLKQEKHPIVSRLDTKPGSNNPAVPDDLGAWLMWKEIRTNPGRRWLVDGFPKCVKHLEEFLNLIPTPSLTLIFECPQDVSLQRVAKRGKLAGGQARPEDLNQNVSRKRIEDSHSNMAHILQVLEDRKMNFVLIDTNRAEDLIQDELRQIISANGLAR